VKTIHESGKLLLTVISDVLDFSRIESGKLELESISFKPRAVMGRVTALMAEIARSKGVALQSTISADIPRVLRGDPERFKQCL